MMNFRKIATASNGRLVLRFFIEDKCGQRRDREQRQRQAAQERNASPTSCPRWLGWRSTR